MATIVSEDPTQFLRESLHVGKGYTALLGGFLLLLRGVSLNYVP